MTQNKCEICKGDGTFKSKDGRIRRILTMVPPYPEKLDLRATKFIHWRCMKHLHSIITFNYKGGKR